MEQTVEQYTNKESKQRIRTRTIEKQILLVSTLESNTTQYQRLTVDSVMINVDVEYLGSRPSLSGSALRCPYELWCYHFHWGTQNDNGSEHRIMQQGFPMEIHLLFYNICYKSTEEAMKAKDGLLVLVYMCMLVSDDNKTLNIITNKIKKINQPGQSVEINSFPLSDLFDNNFQKYLMYWGSKENDPSNPALWLISSKPVHISEKQVRKVLKLLKN
ncbi:carbonic anhydrase 7-like [Daktulosphaira vitifoliae]|uniref:carbonic anhydrase 7-like n=1 Tax=Daktulosphaira vitifoliae TaxID=58002 RepID=UPI0021AA756C|nr:carbonic anhydrase 7-like [Daktulosphaira vitifoliae]